MTQKLRISIYGNCQSLALASTLAAFAGFREKFELVKIEPVHLVGESALAAFIENTLPTLDVLLYQPVRNGYRGSQAFGSDYLLERLHPKARAISFPSIQFFGYYPSHFLFKKPDQQASALSQQLLGMKISELYHFRQVAEAFLSGLSLAEAIEAFDQGSLLDDEQALARKAASQQHLFEAEHKHAIDIRVGKFIENRHRQALLFHTPSHPSGEILAYVCGQIAERLGIEPRPAEIQAATALDPLNIITYPIQRFVADALSLDFPLPRALSIPRKSIHLEIGDMVERYYALYQQLGWETVAGNVQGYAAASPPAKPRLAEPSLSLPETVTSGEAFELRAENIPAGTLVLADKHHVLGRLDAQGKISISLAVAGRRSIDAKVGGRWISASVTVQKPAADKADIQFDELVSFDQFKLQTIPASAVQLDPALGLSESAIRELTKGFTEATWPMIKPGYDVKEIQVFNLKGPVMLGHTGFIAVGGSLFEPSLTPVYRNSWRTKLGSLTADQPKRLKGTYACIFNWTHKNYWHWHLQCLPNILVLEELGLLDDVTLVVPALKGWQRNSLELMGIPAGRILEIEDQAYHFENLLFSTLISGHNRDLPAICVRIFDRIRSRLGIVPGGTSKLYLSRFDTRLRKIVNEDEVAAALGSIGYESFTPGQFTYQEQIRKLASARFVVGNHGAGLTNMGFASQGALLEIFPGTYLRGGYRVQCSLLDQPYSFRTYPVIKNGREKEAHHLDGLRWQVPVDRLLADVRGFEELVGQGF